MVVVTNAAGSVTSLPALLNLLVPPPTLQMPAPTLLRWTGLSNFLYRVESATNPAAPAWTTLGTAFAPGPDIVFSNTWLQDPCRLFRVVCP